MNRRRANSLFISIPIDLFFLIPKTVDSHAHAHAFILLFAVCPARGS